MPLPAHAVWRGERRSTSGGGATSCRRAARTSSSSTAGSSDSRSLHACALLRLSRLLLLQHRRTQRPTLLRMHPQPARGEGARVRLAEEAALATLPQAILDVDDARRLVQQVQQRRQRGSHALLQRLHLRLRAGIGVEQQRHLAMRLHDIRGAAEEALASLHGTLEPQQHRERRRLLEQQPQRHATVARARLAAVAQLAALPTAAQRRRVGRMHLDDAAPQAVLGAVEPLHRRGQVGQAHLPRQHVQRQAAHAMPRRVMAAGEPPACVCELHVLRQQLGDGRLQQRERLRVRGRAGQLQLLGQVLARRPTHGTRVPRAGGQGAAAHEGRDGCERGSERLLRAELHVQAAAVRLRPCARHVRRAQRRMPPLQQGQQLTIARHQSSGVLLGVLAASDEASSVEDEAVAGLHAEQRGRGRGATIRAHSRSATHTFLALRCCCGARCVCLLVFLEERSEEAVGRCARVRGRRGRGGSTGGGRRARTPSHTRHHEF